MKGIILKGVGGFYYVSDGKDLYECKARGIFRKEGMVPHVGDYVVFAVLEDGKGIIDEITPRKNVFSRPPIANVDCFLVVSALTQPALNLTILDQFLIMAEEKRTEILLCFNKAELASAELKTLLLNTYEGLYPVFFTSGKTGVGMEALKKALSGKLCALAGPSGVGKSTLLNFLSGSYAMETGAVSEKTSRGKHTTRHAQLFPMEHGGMLFDTPGFTSFQVLDAEEAELQFLFPEMAPFLGTCRYDNCRHLKEPGCSVCKAVKAGVIKESRYRSYENMMDNLKLKRRF